MQTRRAFLFNSAANVITFAASGSLVITGKEKAQEAIKNYKQERTPPEVGLPIITVNHTADFALGGVLGLAIKKIVEQKMKLSQESIKLKQLNKELSSTVSKLQKLEDDDLPSIEKILEEIVRKKIIPYEVNKNSNTTESILGLLNAIFIYTDSQEKAVQPFIEEVQKLREAFTQPFTKQLQSDTDIDAVIKEAKIEALRTEKLIQYISTVTIKALDRDGSGEKMGKKLADSLLKQDLVNDAVITALRQTLIDVIKSSPFITAFTEAISTAVTEYGTAYKLVDSIVEEFQDSKIPDDDPCLLALKNGLKNALESDDVSKKLCEIVSNITSESDFVELFMQNLQKTLGRKQLLKSQ